MAPDVAITCFHCSLDVTVVMLPVPCPAGDWMCEVCRAEEERVKSQRRERRRAQLSGHAITKTSSQPKVDDGPTVVSSRGRRVKVNVSYADGADFDDSDEDGSDGGHDDDDGDGGSNDEGERGAATVWLSSAVAKFPCFQPCCFLGRPSRAVGTTCGVVQFCVNDDGHGLGGALVMQMTDRTDVDERLRRAKVAAVPSTRALDPRTSDRSAVIATVMTTTTALALVALALSTAAVTTTARFVSVAACVSPSQQCSLLTDRCMLAMAGPARWTSWM